MKHFLRLKLLLIFLCSSTFVFAQCPTILSISSTNKTCNPGPDNGTITITMNDNGYTGSYLYQILGVPSSGPIIFQTFSGSAPNHTFINLPVALYNVFVTPGVPCANVVGTPQSITEPTTFASSVTTITPSCTPGTGGIDLSVSGGTPPYAFAWTGPTVIGDVEDPTGLNTGIYSVIITDANSCSSTINNISVPVSTIATAGTDQVICAFSATLAGNTPVLVNETGTWTVQSGTAVFANLNDPNTTASGLSSGDNILRWTITDSGGICPGTFDDVTIHVDQPPTVSAAGTDQALCNVATTSLAGNAAVIGTGAWSIVSGAGGTVVTPASATSTFNGVLGTTYVLRWTISNGSCPPSTDDVQVRFDILPTVSAAGVDQALCNVATTSLAGNVAVVGTGAWSIVSGAGGTVVTPASATSTFNGVLGTTYVLRWTISNGSCTPSTDDVQIQFDSPPTISAAGTDQTICAVTTNLAGNAAVVGTGTWTIQSGAGGTIVSPNVATSAFNGAAGTTYVLRWTISNGSCPPSTDDVQIQFDIPPTISAAGVDQALCNVATTSLAGNVAVVGTGAWSIVSGAGGTVVTPASATSTFNGVLGTTYVLRWTISNGSCTPSTDDVQIQFDSPPTISAAGTDQTICAVTTNLAGNAAVVGTGTWTIQSGAGGTIVSPNVATSAFNGAAGTTYVLRWTISNGSCTSSFDDVSITFDQAPTISAAGADQALCNVATTSLAGNAAVVGTGAWSIVSGAGGTVVTPASATSTFNGVLGTTYVLRWTISNGSCTPSTDDVQIQFDIPPTISAAGADQALCNVATTSLAGNAAVVGTGAWSIVSGAGGTVVTPASATSTFNGVLGTTYVLRWTISNGSCTPSTDDVQIQFDSPPTISAAGTDQTICAVTTNLAGNAAVVGTGTWTIQSGAGGTIVSPNVATSAFNGAAGTTYVLRWTISNGSCTPSTDDVSITFDQAPTVSAAGADQALCNVATTSLAGNVAVAGTGAWSIVSGAGGTIVTPASATSTFNGVLGTTYVLRWTITSSCASSTDDVDIAFDSPPTTAVAGGDQTVCGPATLAGNAPVVGTGLWTIITGAGGSFADATNPITVFSGTGGVTYTIRWTISNGSCTDSFDETDITFDINTPTASNAGPNQSVCATSATLAGNTPVVGIGAWSVVTGAGGSFADAADPGTVFTGTAGVTYTLRWTISSGACTPSTDDVAIAFDIAPTTSAAGADQIGCSTTATLAGNVPVIGTGAWSVVTGAGGSFADAADPLTVFTGTAGVTYTLRWTITSSCGNSTDDVDIEFESLPTTAVAGGDQTVCGPATLAGNTPVVGTGLWTIITGAGGSFTDATNPTTVFSGTGGVTYTIRWTISNGSCTDSFDETDITFDTNTPTTSNAGPNQSVCATNATLAGNIPVVGIGAWSVVTGAGGSFADAADPGTVFTGTAGVTYTLRWTISSGVCTPSTDDVSIAFDIAPTTSAAGADQTVCSTTATLAGNVPTSGAGAWSVVTGAGGSFADAADPLTVFTGTAGVTYTLRWTITSSCANTTDDVDIEFESLPTTAVAGGDQTICGPATLAGNTPVVGTGLWTIITGAGGSFTDATNPTTVFSGTGGVTYTIRWTISNGLCTDSFDETDITFDTNTPTTSNAGPNQSVCATNATLAGNTPVVGIGAWSVVTGVGGSFADAADPGTVFTGTAGVTYTLRWTISSGACTPSTDDVAIAFDIAPTTSAAGADQTVCSTTATLAGNVPTSGTGAWSVVTGAGGSFADAADPLTVFTGTAGVTYTLEWSISNSCASSTDQVTVKLDAAPTVSNAGPDQVLCAVFTTNLNANVPVTGVGVWTIVTGAGGAVITPSNPTSQFVGSAGNSYTLRWIITNGSCVPSTDDVIINFAASPAVTSPVTVCVNTAAPTLTATASGATSFNWYLGTGVTRTFLSTTATGSFTAGAELNLTTPGSVTYEVTAVYGCGESVGSPIVVNVSNTGACSGGGGSNCFAFATSDPVVETRPSCANQNDGQLIFGVKGGTGTYVVTLYDSVSSPIFTQAQIGSSATPIVFNSLSPSLTYFYKIDDGINTCTLPYSLPVQTTVTASATSFTNAKCFGEATGTAVINASGSQTGQYFYSTDDGLSWVLFTPGNVISGLPPNGTYNILVAESATDACAAAVSVTINNANPDLQVVTTITDATCNNDDGKIVITPPTAPNIGGGGPYKYALSNGTSTTPFQTSTTFDNLAGGVYTLLVQDGIGCVKTITPVSVTFPGFVNFSITSSAADCTNNGISGSISVDITDIGGVYQVALTTDQINEPADSEYVPYSEPYITFPPVARGTYFVYVKSQTSSCPTRSSAINIGGSYAVNFTIAPQCENNQVSVILENLTGEPNIPIELTVFDKELGIQVGVPIPLGIIPVTAAIRLDYNDPRFVFLQIPGKEYQFQINQIQTTFCQFFSPFVDFTTTRPVFARAKPRTSKDDGESYPDEFTGKISIIDFDGGLIPYEVRIEMDSASVSGQTFETVFEEVQKNTNLQFVKDYENIPAGRYIIQVRDSIGCLLEFNDRVPLDIDLFIPNIFTPNNDALNDVFFVRNLPTNEGKLTISDRWGIQVFSTSSYKNDWAGEGLADGVYYYTLQTTKETKKGWVEILRGVKP
jgi:gliding motility-associated-like protein